MRSIFRYPGGKIRRTIQQWILSYKPPRVREYREPFVGGGGVFFAIKPGSVERRWINDMNVGLMDVYRALADRPDEFIARCREIEPARPDDPMTDQGPDGGKSQNARLKAEFDRVRLNQEEDQAYRYLFVNRTVFGGRVNYDRPSRLYFSKPEGWGEVIKGDRLEKAAAWINGARITCGDYGPLLTEPGEDVWVYLDPPYVCNDDRHPNSQLYQHVFTKADHRQLAEAVRRCPHRVCLSYDDDPEGFVRMLYPESDGFVIVRGEWAYCGSTNGTKDRGRELLIMNYEPPDAPLFSTNIQVERLTPPEATALACYEETVDRNLKSAFEAGAALRGIRDELLYRQAATTFEAYCQQRWQMTGSRAHQLIDAALVLSGSAERF